MMSYRPGLSSSVKSRISLSRHGEETLGLPCGKARSRESRFSEASSGGGLLLAPKGDHTWAAAGSEPSASSSTPIRVIPAFTIRFMLFSPCTDPRL